MLFHFILSLYHFFFERTLAQRKSLKTSVPLFIIRRKIALQAKIREIISPDPRPHATTPLCQTRLHTGVSK